MNSFFMSTSKESNKEKTDFLLALLKSAPEKDLLQTVKVLKKSLEVDAFFLDALLSQARSSEAILSLAPFSVDNELYLAKDQRTPLEVLENLGKSSRKRTLYVLLSRKNLPKSTLERLHFLKDKKIQEAFLLSPSLRLENKVELFEKSNSALRYAVLEEWCSEKAFLRYYLENAVRVFASQDRAITYILNCIPDKLEKDEAVLLEKMLEGILFEGKGPFYVRAREGDFLHALRRASLKTQKKHLDSDATPELSTAILDPYEVFFVREYFSADNWLLTQMFPRIWTDEETLEEAFSLERFRHLALAHEKLPLSLREETLKGGQQKFITILAHNPNLTKKEVKRLLHLLPEREKWRLLLSDLTQEERKGIYRSAAPELIETIGALLEENLPKNKEEFIDNWLEKDLVSYVLKNKEVLLLKKDKLYAYFINIVLHHKPELASLVAENFFLVDGTQGESYKKIIELYIKDLYDPEVLETFASLLSSWNGTLAELVKTSQELSKA